MKLSLVLIRTFTLSLLDDSISFLKQPISYLTPHLLNVASTSKNMRRISDEFQRRFSSWFWSLIFHQLVTPEDKGKSSWWWHTLVFLLHICVFLSLLVICPSPSVLPAGVLQPSELILSFSIFIPFMMHTRFPLASSSISILIFFKFVSNHHSCAMILTD